MSLELKGVPFPPTVNSMYAGKERRYKAKVATDFEYDFDIWALKNMRLVCEAKTIVRENLIHDNKVFLSLGLTYVVPYETLYTASGKVKKIDVTNRVKGLLDCLSTLLEIDDSRMFLGKVEFLLGTHKYVNININTTRIKAVTNGSEKEKGSKEKDSAKNQKENDDSWL